MDRRGFKNIKTPEQLEEKIESMVEDDGFNYLFIDEVQNVKGFESVVQAYAEEGYSVFLTGSNSYLLSDEISTKLTGRYLNFEVHQPFAVILRILRKQRLFINAIDLFLGKETI